MQGFYNRAESQLQLLGSFANQLRSSLYEDITRLELVSNELEEGVRTLRLLPLSTMFNLFLTHLSGFSGIARNSSAGDVSMKQRLLH